MANAYLTMQDRQRQVIVKLWIALTRVFEGKLDKTTRVIPLRNGKLLFIGKY